MYTVANNNFVDINENSLQLSLLSENYFTHQILVRDAITEIFFHVENAMTEFVLETLKAQHKKVDNRL